MPTLSFRSKLLLAMMLVVGAVTLATLYVTQSRVRATYEEVFQNQFSNQIRVFADLQATRLGAIQNRCLALAQSVYLLAALDEGDPEVIYTAANNELRHVLNPDGPESQGISAAFYRFLDADGEVIGWNDERIGFATPEAQKELQDHLRFIQSAVKSEAAQQVGLLVLSEGAGLRRLFEVVVTKIEDSVTHEVKGAVVLGFPTDGGMAQTKNTPSQIKTAIFIDGELFDTPLAAGDRTVLAETLTREIAKDTTARSDLQASLSGVPYRVFYRPLNPDSAFPPAYQVCLYSMREALAVQNDLRVKVLALGITACLIALGLSLILAHNLSVPIRALVRGTDEIQGGNFAYKVPVRGRDEIGQLAESFNEMADGLAQKEKYRSVLDKVADKEVARQLMSGEIALGGEMRQISVLFCDIRGFTALSQNMDPSAVIEMLNEHFTPLTKVVYEHHGVVDKFVGDLIMAVFGAPRSYQNDALNAALSAVRMIEERQQMNDASSTRKITIGIGVATGPAVAGCMGSIDRLNYTVIGERVNLGSRLCSQAGRMEVVIDESTRQQLGALAEVEPLPPLTLKGFSQPVQAYKLKRINPTLPKP